MTSPHASMAVVPGIRLADILVKDQVRKDLGDISSLAESIKRVGLLQPLAVTHDRVLVFGHRRLTALRVLGWESAPTVEVSDTASALEIAQIQMAENTERMELKPSEVATQARLIADLEREEGRRRMSLGGSGGLERSADVGGPSTNSRETRDAVAKVFGIGHSKLSQINTVAAAADKGDQRAVAALAEMDRTGNVNGPYARYSSQSSDRTAVTSMPATQTQEEEEADEPSTSRIGFRKRAHHKMVSNAMSSLSAIAQLVSGITELDDSVSPEDAAAWGDDINRALSTIRQFSKRLKEHSNEAQQ